MAKCTVEPKLDFDKFTEACERFKKICERELGDACAYIDDEVYPVILKEMDIVREWIPTSLCLPQRDRPVLVAVKTKDRLPKWIEKQTYHYVTDIDVYDDNGWMDNGKNAVAWQPLPAPYKGE